MNYSVLILCVALSGCAGAGKEILKEKVKERVAERLCPPTNEVVVPLRIIVDVYTEGEALTQ